MNKTEENTALVEAASAFIAANLKGAFRPVAYFDSALDCIRVITRDCSVVEHRVNQFLTIAEDNHPASPAHRYVGFTIKGVNHFIQSGRRDPASVDIGEMLQHLLEDLPKNMPAPDARRMVDFAVSIAFNLLENVPEKSVPLKKAA